MDEQKLYENLEYWQAQLEAANRAAEYALERIRYIRVALGEIALGRLDLPELEAYN